MHVAMSVPRNLYNELQLQPTASASEIRTAFRRAALHAHPDKGGSTVAFHRIAFAFEVLSCPRSREIYDMSIKHYFQISRSKAPCGPSRTAPYTRSVFCDKRKRVNETTWPAAKMTRTKETCCPQEGEPCTGEDCTPDDKDHDPAETDHGTHATRLVLEQLRTAVQALPAPQRRVAITQMPQNVRAELLEYMINDKPCAPHPTATPTTNKNSPRKVRGWNSQTRGTDVRAVKHLHKTSYQAQLRIRHLRMYTRAQDDIADALNHQMLLVQARHAIHAAGEAIWHDPPRFAALFNCVLQRAGSSAGKIGLSVFIFMRADEWICRPATITSPVMAMEDAVATHLRLCKARQTSWEELRAVWVSLMQQTRQSRMRQLSKERAMSLADMAHMKLLQRRLCLAVAAAERALKLRSQAEAKAAKLKAQNERLVIKQKAAAAALFRRSAMQKKREWAARRRWYRSRDLTIEEIMHGVPHHL